MKAVADVDLELRRLHGWLCESPHHATKLVRGVDQGERLSCELPGRHREPKAHHGRDAAGVEWVWWEYGNGRSICRPCDNPVLP